MEYTIELNEKIDENELYVEIKNFLANSHKLESQIVETKKGLILQAKETRAWKKYSGMNLALTINLTSSDDLLIVEFSETKWLDKAAAGAVGWIAFAPLLVTGAIGAYKQSSLPKKIIKFIEMEIIDKENLEKDSFIKEDITICHKCDSKLPKGSRFCSSCGAKLFKKCKSCDTPLELDAKYCNECGERIDE